MDRLETHYQETLAQQVAEHLAQTLAGKEKGHRACVTDLPQSLLGRVCARVRQIQPDTEAYVLADEDHSALEISPTRLIERRNVADGVLLVFLPPGLKTAAEDSYGEHTFEHLSARPALYELRRRLVGELSVDFPYIEKVVSSPHVRHQQSIEHVVRYLLAVQSQKEDPQSPGRYLYFLELIPDLELQGDQIEARIDRNSKKVGIIAQPEKPLLAKIEALKLKPDTIQGELFLHLHDTEGSDLSTWLPRTLEWGLTFDRWQEADSRPIEEPPILHFDALGKFKGLVEEAGDFVAYSTLPVTASWHLSPARPEYLSHFVLSLLREEREDEELLPPKRIAASRRSHKLDFRNVDLEDEGRVAARLEVRAMSLDGETLVSDFSDPFWIEKGESGEWDDTGTDARRNPHGEEVRSVSEAVLIGALRIRTKSRRKAEVGVHYERSGWASSSRAKGAVQDIYRLRLTTGEIFHLKFVPVLRDVERSILDQPLALRAFNLTLPSCRSAMSQQVDTVSVNLPDELSAAFLHARAALFGAVVQATPASLIETMDLRPYANLVLDYVRAYGDLLDRVPLQTLARLDTLLVTMPGTQAVLLAPTHPLRMLWLLQYQRLLGQWTQGVLECAPDQVNRVFERSSIERISSLNMPAFLTTEPEQVWTNTNNINLFWSVFLPVPVERSHESLSFLYRGLSVPIGKADVSTVQAGQLAERIALYLDRHPYVRTLVLNVVNPGDGLLILDCLRALQSQAQYSQRNFEVRFFGRGSYDQLGVAFDELMNEPDEQRGQDVDDSFLEASSNPLLPKLTFAKHRVAELTESDQRIFDAHLTLLLDYFGSSVHTVVWAPSRASTSLYGLLTEFQTTYHTAEGIVWSRSIHPGPCPGLDSGDAVPLLLSETHSKLLQRVASAITSGAESLVPAIQLRLGEQDRTLVDRVHAISDWVITIDRNFGIEYFDNPEALENYRQSYLIDFIPQFLSEAGRRLIVSTAWLSEIEMLLARALKGLGLLTERLRPIDVLNALRALSGKIALQVLAQPVHSEPLIGLGLAQILMANSERLQSEVLIPAPTHPDLFGPTADKSLVLAQFDQQELRLCVVAVRFCRGTFIGDEFTAREEIRVETEAISDQILSQFAAGEQQGHLDQALRNKAWAGVLGFYVDRAARYGLITKDSKQRFQEGLDTSLQDGMSVQVRREGLIFSLVGVSKPAEDYHGVQLQVIGQDELASFGRASVTTLAVATEIAASPSHVVEIAAVDQPPPSRDGVVGEIERPAESASAIEIDLGEGRDTRRPVVWAPDQPHPKRLTNQHILIVGKSGSGKTQTIMAMVHELWKQRLGCLLFDFHGEYCDVSSKLFRETVQAKVLDAAQGIPINPLTVPLDPITAQRADYRNVVYQVTESLADIFRLGDIQKRILKRAVENAYVEAGFTRNPATWDRSVPAFSNVWDQLRVIEAVERGPARNLVARVEPLFEAEVFRGEDQTFDDLLLAVTIVRLSSLANKELRTAISRFFLQKVYERMLALGPSGKQRLFCIIDEAHKLSHDPTLTDLIKESRKYGVGLILSSQETRDFDRSIFANTGTLIALQMEIEDARIMAENLGLVQPTERSAAVEIILRQRPGQALVRNNHYQPYTQVQIRPFARRVEQSEQ